MKLTEEELGRLEEKWSRQIDTRLTADELREISRAELELEAIFTRLEIEFGRRMHRGTSA